MALAPRELGRKLVHLCVGGLAFLLRDLPWWGAIAMGSSACLFNWQILPRIGGRSLWRNSEHDAAYARGILIYPIAVLGLIVAFPGERRWMAAALWGMLAFGDGMASLIGQAVAGPRLPWNESKSWAGLLAFFLFGGLGASLLAAWTLGLPLAAALSGWTLGVTIPLALACALVESAPTTLDDNLTVPLVGGLALPLLAQADLRWLLADPDAGRRLLLGLVVGGGIALLARFAHLIDVPGALSAIAIGALITLGLGLPAFAIMLSFSVLGSAATRIGHGTKAARGIAQQKGGERGWRNAWANGAVPAFLALVAGMSPADAKGFFAFCHAASVATAAADTCSSELGKAYGRSTMLITSLRAVPAGTAGGVSLVGTLGGGIATLIVACVGAVCGLYSWSAAPLVAVAGLLGSLGESAVGSVALRRGWLGPHLLNVLNTMLGACLGAALMQLDSVPAAAAR